MDLTGYETRNSGKLVSVGFLEDETLSIGSFYEHATNRVFIESPYEAGVYVCLGKLDYLRRWEETGVIERILTKEDKKISKIHTFSSLKNLFEKSQRGKNSTSRRSFVRLEDQTILYFQLPLVAHGN
ncbi:hypothetical protein COU53_00355 [Candidatus Pacearchaeota archaeon CG10_big_fil_rev_8_21_14_0_10_30_48]|nr:MAG: hypothetical protein COU53_00355 [Candidatus Pacearchaeota archaeon CG10_big_fil_rev_8_21_14_0_10_30_48]